MYVSVCVCVRVCGCAYICVCVNLWREGRNNTSGQTCHFFVAAWYAWNVFHVYIMTINYCQIWKVLALDDQLCGKIVPVSLARLPWQASLGRYGWVASNGVEACRVLSISTNHGK